MNQYRDSQESFDLLFPNSEELKAAINHAAWISDVQKTRDISPLHILCALLHTETAVEILQEVMPNQKYVQAFMAAVLNLLDTPIAPAPEHTRRTTTGFMTSCEKIIEQAYYGACYKHKIMLNVGAMLWAIVDRRPASVKHVLDEYRIYAKDIIQTVMEGKNHSMVNMDPIQYEGTHEHINTLHESPDANTPNYAVDMVEMARNGELPCPRINESVMVDIFTTLLRKIKRSVLLVGPPGVGKTAIAEYLAHMIASGNCPKDIQGRRLIMLDVAGMVAGTSLRGQMEARLKQFIEDRSPDDIVFIDEVHTIMGAGASDGSSMDIAQIIKPALARGAFACIGSTTLREYQEFIAPDGAMVRRFRIVNVQPPSMDETRDIIKHTIQRVKPERRITVSDDAIEAILTLTHKEMPTRHWPDKAIDVLDEAVGHARLHGHRIIRADHIAEVISNMTGAPIGHQIIPNLSARIKERIHGQDMVCEQVANRINRAFIGLRNSTTPIGRFLFTGPTGTGKTEMAKTLADILGMKTIRIDMSEYQEGHSVSRMIGAPNGYKGADRGGLLTEAIREHKNSVVIFDEVEKGHPNIRMLLLQILNEGVLTDGRGNTADFRSSIVIMTSNIGASEAGARVMTFSGTHDRQHTIHGAINRAFPPELLGRLDERFIFQAPTREVTIACARAKIEQMSQAIHQHHGSTIDAGHNAIEALIDMPFDHQSNGRGIQQHIEKHIGDALLHMAQHQGIPTSGTITVTVKDGQVTLEPKRALPPRRRTQQRHTPNTIKAPVARHITR